MSFSDNVWLFEAAPLIESLKALGATDEARLRAIMAQCGLFLADTYVLRDHERAGEHNPFLVVIDLIEDAFDLPGVFFSAFDIGSTPGVEALGWVDRAAIADQLGITLQD